MSDLIGNPEDRFSHNEAQLKSLQVRLSNPNTETRQIPSTQTDLSHRLTQIPNRLFDLMLYVNGKQLRSCWDGHTVLGQASRMQFTSISKVPILSPVTDNLLFLNQQKRENIFPRKNVHDARIDRGTAACEADTLPTELPRPVTQSLLKKKSDAKY